MRGEQWVVPVKSGKPLGSPPLARGTVLFLRLYMAAKGITPACAGNSNSTYQQCKANMDHPRLRGEQ